MPPRTARPAPPAQPPPSLLTVAQVATTLQLDPYTVRRYIARGILPGLRLPGTRELRVDNAELQRFLDTARVVAR